MRALILSLAVLSVMGMQPADSSTASQTQSTSPPMTFPDKQPPNLTLSLSILNSYFTKMNVLERKFVTDFAGAGLAVQLKKPTINTLTATIFVVDSLGNPLFVLYTHKYSWVKAVNSLVSLECSPTTITPTPVVIAICSQAIQLASNIIESIISSPVQDFDSSGYDQMVQCIHQKITNWVSTIVRTCFLKTIGNADLVRQKMDEKIKAMEAMGYVCQAGSCYKETSSVTSTIATNIIGGGTTGLARNYKCTNCAKPSRLAATADAGKSLDNAYLEDFGSL